MRAGENVAGGRAERRGWQGGTSQVAGRNVAGGRAERRRWQGGTLQVAGRNVAGSRGKRCRWQGGTLQVAGENVAGGRAERCRWQGKTLQVCIFGITCNAYRPHKTNNVAGWPFFADLQRFGTRPATFRDQTCNTLSPDLHHSLP